jgi:hypothetical protein
MTTTLRRTLFLTIFTTILLSGCGSLPFVSGEVRMSADELTNKLAKRFPMDKTVAGLLDVTLAQPRVVLSEPNNRIAAEFFVNVKLALTSRQVSGTVTVSGRPEYVPETRALFLRDAKIDRVRMENMPDALSAALAKSVSAISREVLEDKPLHTFKADDFTRYGVRYTPERIVVRGDYLVLALK